jgi:HTH-type transcriptional regulator/antitoxin HigA
MSTNKSAGSVLIPWDTLDHAPSPGATLREVLAKAGMSQRDLARRTALTPKHINQLLSGAVPLSADVAERLSLVTGVAARLWNQLEADYRTVQTRAMQQHHLEAEYAWVASMPVAELVARGELPDEPSDRSSRARQLLSYFGVASSAAWREIWLQPNAALRQSTAFEADHAAVATWIRAGQHRARAADLAEFDQSALRDLVPNLVSMTRLPATDALLRARQSLATVGVALVFAPEFAGSRLNGATTWAKPGLPAILLSGRGRRFDIVYFTLLHEIGHLLLHGRKETFVTDERPAGPVDIREKQADDFAREALLPSDLETELSRITTTAQIREFSDRTGIGVSIVAGRLCRDHSDRWSYQQVHSLREKVDVAELGD